eukprot:COSAG02_NODE_55872_length_288_cov_0.814815_1_plen_32_part_10
MILQMTGTIECVETVGVNSPVIVIAERPGWWG